MQKRMFKGSSYKMPKGKITFWLIYTLSIVIQEYRNRVTWFFFKLEAFNCKVSFYRLNSDKSYRHFTLEV